MVSLVKVAASTTVGTPIAITGTPKFGSSSAFRTFPIPEPGTIPVVEICIVELILSTLLEANASTAITISGFELSTIPFYYFTNFQPGGSHYPGRNRTHFYNIYIFLFIIKFKKCRVIKFLIQL